MFYKVATLAQLAEFDEIIDVRSPGEYSQDHLPGAINCPVLDDDERARVGTLYCQESPFAARRVGAVLVARNIAQHIEQHFQDRPKSWRPLVYCWRGGQRSGAMATIMGQVGWPVHQLARGYKAYRHQVIQELEQLPATLRLHVLCGPTGAGKSRLLRALARTGHQVLDLEQIARHRGSVLGQLPDVAQPSQKSFESQLRQQILSFSPERPVYIEAESRSIGRLSLPNALLAALRAAPCLQLDTPRAERVRALLQDYVYFIQQPQHLSQQLERLRPLFAREQMDAWQSLIQQQKFEPLVHALLEQHYDPLYQRSTGQHFTQQNKAEPLELTNLSPATLEQIARALDQ